MFNYWIGYPLKTNVFCKSKRKKDGIIGKKENSKIEFNYEELRARSVESRDQLIVSVPTRLYWDLSVIIKTWLYFVDPDNLHISSSVSHLRITVQSVSGRDLNIS